MSEYLDNILHQWAIEATMPLVSEPQTEYEMRAVKNMMYHGLKLLQAAQTDADAVAAELAALQQAQVDQTFQDAIFGSDPNAFDYAVETATGQLTGQRCRSVASDAKKLHGKRSPLCISSSGQVVLSADNAQVFARLLLPGLLKFQDAPPVPELADLPVAAPSLSPNPGWEQGGVTTHV